MTSAMTTAASDLRVRPRQVRRRRSTLILRVLIGVLFFAAGALAIASELTVRHGEVWLSRHVLGALTGATTIAEGVGSTPTIMFTFDDQHWYAMRVTVECAIAFYVGGVLFFTGLLALIPRLNVLRLLLAAAASIAGLVALNQVRLLMLEFVFSHFGRDAFDWAHSLVGSFLMLFGIAGCLLLFFQLAVKHRHRGASA
jgi:exosortase/archaeosortase family protein